MNSDKESLSSGYVSADRDPLTGSKMVGGYVQWWEPYNHAVAFREFLVGCASDERYDPGNEAFDVLLKMPRSDETVALGIWSVGWRIKPA